MKEGKDMCEALLLSVRQTSLRLSMSRSSTYRLLQTGSLRSLKIFGARRVPVEAIDELIRRLQKEAADGVSNE